MKWRDSTKHKPAKAMCYRVRRDPRDPSTEGRCFFDGVCWSDLWSGKRVIFQFWWWRE